MSRYGYLGFSVSPLEIRDNESRLYTIALYWPRHAKMCLRAYADCEGQAQTAAQSDQGLHCPQTGSMDTKECMN